MARDGSPFDRDRPATALGLEQGCAACLFRQPRPIALLMPSYPIDYRRRRATFRQWNWLVSSTNLLMFMLLFDTISKFVIADCYVRHLVSVLLGH
jgi:hypothetical protein